MDEFDSLLQKFETSDTKATFKSKDKPDILVIDDDESIRRGLKNALTHKYAITTASSVKQGLEELNKAFHCVILDVKMQDISGFEAYPRLKEKCPEVPIVFFTAFQSEHDLQEIINKYKPEGYVEKGKDITFLEHLIENAIKRYRLILENEEYKKDLEKKVIERTQELFSVEKEKHLLELDLALGEQLLEIMHSDTSLLINPVATHFNVSKDVLDSFEDYKQAVLTRTNTELAFDDLEYEMVRMRKTYVLARGVIDDYRRNFKALHELRTSDNPLRNPNQDLIYLQSLVNSQFAFTESRMDLELADNIPDINLIRRAQSSFLELAINAVKHGKAKRLIARTELIPFEKDDRFERDMVAIHLYNNGEPVKNHDKLFIGEIRNSNSAGTGLYRVKARIELNSGTIGLEKSEIDGYPVHFAIYFPVC